MSHELPRTWLLPMLLAAANPAEASAADAVPPAVEQAQALPSEPSIVDFRELPAVPEEQFGAWRILEELGSGGMGTVYLAASTGPVSRRAAVKVIRADRVDPDTVARFRAEQQALADANHDGVVRLFDVGTTSAGRPWLAMELVYGEPITSYCEQRALDLDARLQLFGDVAHAVQHLHDRGIRHGDLKPENILVTECDGSAIPKLIDLGLATVPGHPPTDEHAAAGTPTYMAPEQFTMPATAIDNRSEVYTLGVVLHEVLTGKRPGGTPTFDPEGLLTTRVRAAPAVDAGLPGSVRRILGRALAQQREARQASAGELALELQRTVARRSACWQAVAATGIALVSAAVGTLLGWLALP